MLIVGSQSLVKTLINVDLIDEYRLMVFPIILGRGRRLFEENEMLTTLALQKTLLFKSGTIVLVYEAFHPPTAQAQSK